MHSTDKKIIYSLTLSFKIIGLPIRNIEMVSKNLNLCWLILVGWLGHQCNHSSLLQRPSICINWIDPHMCVQLEHHISSHRFRVDSHVPRTITRGSCRESRIGFRNLPFTNCLNNENDKSSSLEYTQPPNKPPDGYYAVNYLWKAISPPLIVINGCFYESTCYFRKNDSLWVKCKIVQSLSKNCENILS